VEHPLALSGAQSFASQEMLRENAYHCQNCREAASIESLARIEATTREAGVAPPARFSELD
jgi:hypothetical protein